MVRVFSKLELQGVPILNKGFPNHSWQHLQGERTCWCLYPGVRERAELETICKNSACNLNQCSKTRTQRHTSAKEGSSCLYPRWCEYMYKRHGVSLVVRVKPRALNIQANVLSHRYSLDPLLLFVLRQALTSLSKQDLKSQPSLSASWVAGIVCLYHQTWLSVANPKPIYKWELRVKAARFKISLKTSDISMYQQQKLGRSFKM